MSPSGSGSLPTRFASTAARPWNSFWSATTPTMDSILGTTSAESSRRGRGPDGDLPRPDRAQPIQLDELWLAMSQLHARRGRRGGLENVRTRWAVRRVGSSSFIVPLTGQRPGAPRRSPPRHHSHEFKGVPSCQGCSPKSKRSTRSGSRVQWYELRRLPQRRPLAGSVHVESARVTETPDGAFRALDITGETLFHTFSLPNHHRQPVLPS